MEIKEIVEKIDRSEKNREEYFNIEALASELDLAGGFFPYEKLNDRIKVYWLENWLCTDTWVGTRIYFFDSEPVALSIQKGRKFDEEFFWVSREAAEKVYDFLNSFLKENLHVKTCDMHEDIGNSYKIDFNEQVLDWSTARYKGSPIELIEKITKNHYTDQQVRIRVLETGEELEIDVGELDFLYHVV